MEDGAAADLPMQENDELVALVVGGCGQLGYGITKALLNDPAYTEVHVFSRNPTINLLPGAKYHAGSVTDREGVEKLICEVKPTIIFHCASPSYDSGNSKPKLFHDVNVQGTRNLLDSALKSTSTRAFVYTSSFTVHQQPFNFTEETGPLVNEASIGNADYYPAAKAAADVLVLEANNPEKLSTCCLRISSLFGERDTGVVTPMIRALETGQQKYQIGDNSALYEAVSVNNATTAHLLAGRALLYPKDGTGARVDGEAFLISNGRPVPFWDICRKVWKASDEEARLDSVTVVPTWLIIGPAMVFQYIFWFLTCGTRLAPGMQPWAVKMFARPNTISIEKARRVLGYEPADDLDETILAAVAWCKVAMAETAP
ncbi:NAD(P)-binding Rossmann-fold containing protein [Glarea lozoyensis ATCC 20868]|uniref:NAD(P)-binding Rossmann-fold containing protein n=1 Tax=Glarea lozoyensis (strain ATCC 20868 / MF5171) TaxID=1116229 RepID=S3CF15_GLAL2|nr:NAD(P)-binding Rossmann-fold containing protein [Glarea lozoyensis ATCC 20868]EPE25092.1 NAD(P)-binding Rossmann-fold containing protein [Glarea lozoyensis ATCC 20868]